MKEIVAVMPSDALGLAEGVKEALARGSSLTGFVLIVVLSRR
jgi:hypothetical protein